jgi:hypothetical protein
MGGGGGGRMSAKPIDVSFFALFEACGIPNRSESWPDYEEGKKIIKGTWPEEYEEGIRALKSYLCL